ncbi:flagellar protein FliO/FliZ [Virgibacillus natechei]|uniref:Flagellar protein FliO/FliZ n=1 Tax=Virgibacillus natechei TaxID=1216297 RepID=A0ABS4IAZ2_9BACI|nr:flagellar biosynthetic protein FliO [Virgibacillus natechei]MBP1968089.1 flagellar protein FliO/FliZ [Virgibacillus natechei]
MTKKLFFSICVTILLTSSVFSVHVEASTNVLDCLNGNSDCEELNEVPEEPEMDEVQDEESQVQNQDEDESVAGSEGSLPLFELVKMFFALLLVLALIYLLLKFLSKRNKLFNQVRSLENLGGISVGQNKSIQIVRIGSKVHLIGVGENVEMLHEITDEEIKSELLHRETNEESEFTTSKILSSFLQPNSDRGKRTMNRKNEFKNQFSIELEKLKQNRKNIIKQNKQKEDKPYE